MLLKLLNENKSITPTPCENPYALGMHPCCLRQIFSREFTFSPINAILISIFLEIRNKDEGTNRNGE